MVNFTAAIQILATIVGPGLVLTIGSPLAAQQTSDSPSLSDKLSPLIKAHQGDVSVCVRNLKRKSGNDFVWRSHEPMPTASLIKLAVMVTAHQLADEGTVRLDQRIQLREEDKVPGSGILTKHFSAGTTITLRDAIRLMIVYSDNTATNLVLDAIGLDSTAEAMSKLGFGDTMIHAKVYRGSTTTIFPERSRKFGLGSTTAEQTVDLLQLIHKRRAASGSACELMLADLEKCEGKDKIAAGLPEGTRFAHKTGAISHARCDAGIVFIESRDSGTQTIAVCVLTANNKDRSWKTDNEAQKLCAQIGRIVVDHFSPPWNRRSKSVGEPLAVGAFGPIVEMLQRTLNARLNPSPELSMDGDFGPATESAVKQFQAANKLTENGIVDEDDWKSLGPLVDEQPQPDPKIVNAERLKRSPVDQLDGLPIVTCKSWIITDADGRIVGGHQPDRPRENASTTKIMTAWLVIKMGDQNPQVLNETLKFSRRADLTRGSTAAVREGESLSVGEALFGLLLPSGNDASVALAEHFGRRLADSKDDADDPLGLFVNAMNQEAKRIGMHNTHFENPHGLTADNHTASAADLAMLARTAFASERFRDYVSTRQHGTTVTGANGYERNIVWKNSNRLLAIDGYDGIKTGTTSRAGACLVSTASRGGQRLFLVVLGSAASESRYVDSRNLYRWAWQELDLRTPE